MLDLKACLKSWSCSWDPIEQSRGSRDSLGGFLCAIFVFCKITISPSPFAGLPDQTGADGCATSGAWSEMSGYLLGVIVSATDPVAVVALLKELGVKAELS